MLVRTVKRRPKKRAKEILKKAQKKYFSGDMSSALGTTIEFDVLNVKYVDTNLTLREDATCHNRCKLDRAGNITEEDTDEADNYHYLSYDKGTGVNGEAFHFKDKEESWEYRGSVCWNNVWDKNVRGKQFGRTAITEVEGDCKSDNKWKECRKHAAKVFAHELGHALGMPHDFKDNHGTGKDKKGEDCDQGIMSYEKKSDKWKKADTWSQCSKEALEGWFAQLSKLPGMNLFSDKTKICNYI